MPNARAEHAKARALSVAEIKAFIAAGVPPEALSRTPDGKLSMVSRDRVVFRSQPDSRIAQFDFARDLRDDEGAVNAFTVLLFDVDGEPADIMAWRPRGPCGFWDGQVCMAGEELVLAPRLDDALDVFETPREWLCAGRDGVLVLSYRRAGYALEGMTLRARSAKHAQYLRTGLARPAPRILVAEPVIRLAA